ncbi:MAG: hypothetical protein M3463_09735 [Verrucomicrobiota bacterium]|nr:hypothetical protein [Verrucomicrobiota bacterium]
MNNLSHRSESPVPLKSRIGTLIAGLTFPLVSVSMTPCAFGDIVARRAAVAEAKSDHDAKASPRSPDDALRAGLEYLLKQQQPDGGWGQGGGWRQGHDSKGGRSRERPSKIPPMSEILA